MRLTHDVYTILCMSTMHMEFEIEGYLIKLFLYLVPNVAVIYTVKAIVDAEPQHSIVGKLVLIFGVWCNSVYPLTNQSNRTFLQCDHTTYSTAEIFLPIHPLP